MFKLYQTSFCPYCVLVIQALQESGLRAGQDFELIDASRGTPAREELVDLGGKSQVPFLVDGDTTMYESSDIISYIRNKYKKSL